MNSIFKTLAFALLMPTMLLTTSCSSEDDALNNNTAAESTVNKGYTLPVTVNVTRQGDEATTRASFNESTRKLEFTAGDQLFVKGNHDDAGKFAGTLDYVSYGTFSGTITTQNEWTGTAYDLFTTADECKATLLPAGYESYEYLSISGSGYDASLEMVMNNTFASTKAAAVEQFSFEYGSYTSGTGFALEPMCAVLNFTINGLAASTEVAVVFSNGYGDITGNVTTDGDGTATFAIGLFGDEDLNDYSLTVGGNDITLVSSSKTLVAGKIYNITRSAASAAAEGHALSASSLGEIVGSDGKAYAVADKDNLPTGVTAVAMIAY